MALTRHDHAGETARDCCKCPGTPSSPCTDSKDCQPLGPLVACASIGATGECSCYHRAPGDISAKSRTNEKIALIAEWARKGHRNITLSYGDDDGIVSFDVKQLPASADLKRLLSELSKTVGRRGQ